MKCTAFRAFERNTLQGFATLVFDSGIIVHDCAMHERAGKRWISLPSRPMLDKECRLVTDENGKLKYVALIEFIDPKTRARWSNAALAAIDEFLNGKEPAGAGSMSGGSVSRTASKETPDG